MKKILIVLGIVLGAFYSNAQCSYTIEASDSWGDGWNGCAVDAQIDGVSVPGSPYSLGGGTFGTFTFVVPAGHTLDLIWSIGSFNNEASYVLKDDAGTTVHTSPTSSPAGVHYSGATTCTGVTCSTPVITGVSNLTSVSADLTWNPGVAPLPTDYTVEWGAVGFTPGIGNEIGMDAAVTGTSFTITGLDPEVAYDAYVISNCTGGAYYLVENFTTLPLCAVPMAPMSTAGAEDVALNWTTGPSNETMWDVEWGVSGTILGDGTLEDNVVDGDMATTNSLPLGVTGLTQLTDYHWYVRAVCDLNTTDGVDTVSYWVGPESFTTAPLCPQPSAFTATAVDTFEMDLAWTAGGLEGAWTIEYGVTGFTPGTGTTFSVTTATDTLIDGLDPETTYDFYLMADCAANGTSPSVGPATATTGVACSPITGVNTTGLTTNTADLAWTAGSTETEWNIVYGETGFDPLTDGTTQNVMTTPAISITGLDAGTTYDFYVEAVCGVDTMATWVGPYTFMTVISCPVPMTLSAMNITNTAANLIWQAGGAETEWNIEWGNAGFTPDNGEELGSVMSTTDNPYYVTGLASCGSYDYYVQAACGAGDLSTWAGPFTFNTLTGDVIAPYTQNFDGATATPNCWSQGPTSWSFQVSGGPGPNYGVLGSVDHTTGAGNFAWMDGSSAYGTNGLTTPMIDFSGITTPYVGYWVLSNNINDAAQNIVTLEAYDGAMWVELGSYSGNNADWVKVEYLIPSTLPTNTQFRLVQSAGTSGGSTFNNDMLVDDFFVVDGPACIDVEAGTAVAGTVCTDPNMLDLFDGITGYVEDNGTWYYPSATTPGAQSFASNGGTMMLTGLDAGFDYTFDYVVTNACSSDTVSMVYNWSPAVNAGNDGMLTTCVNHDVVLIQELNGSVDFGGSWSDDDATGHMVNGIFSPEIVAPGDYEFTYTVDNGTCSDSSMVTVTVEACLGVDANEAAALEVYPNPAHDVVTIANLNVEGNATITLVDVQGKVVYTSAITNVNGNYELDLSGFENGVYIIEITSELSTQNVRVVKH